MIKIDKNFLITSVDLYWFYQSLEFINEPIINLLKTEELGKEASESFNYRSYPFLLGEKEYTIETFNNEVLLLNSEKEKWIKEIQDSYSKEIDKKLQRVKENPENYKKTEIYISGMALADLNAFYGIDFEKMIRAWMTDFGYNVEKICQKATFENYIKSSIDDVYWKFISIGKVVKNETFGFTYQYLDFYLEKCLEEDLNPIDQKFIKEERKENEKR